MTPKELGFFMPPEWAKHDATWLSWPHNLDSWPGKFEPVPDVFIEMIRFLSPHEEVHINVSGAEMEQDIRRRVREAGVVRDAAANIFYHHFPTNDAWCRDHGPNFILRNAPDGQVEKAVVDWGYNAWGGKYPPFDLDNKIPEQVAALKGLQRFVPDMILEGGSIDTNGKGTLLTTTSCLLNPNRNPELSQAEIEKRLKDFLGMTKILWLGDGIVGDDTDGHIDDISRFVNPTTVVTAIEENPDDENYEPLQKNLELLKTFTDQDGKPFDIVEIPMPPKVEFEGERLPASYANFYIANNVVLVPTYRHANDYKVIEILQPLFPGRRVQAVDCTDLVLGLGAIHCVTHEEPSAEALSESTC